MKRILFCAAAFLLAACDRGGNFDATGTFEATEVTVSAEAAGRILRFDAEEGDLLTAGEQVGEIDTVQLYLRRLQLERQRASVRSERPDIAKQAAALREQIAKQQTERRRVENLLKDGAATTKQLDDIDAQLKVLGSQLDATLSTLRNNAASIARTLRPSRCRSRRSKTSSKNAGSCRPFRVRCWPSTARPGNWPPWGGR